MSDVHLSTISGWGKYPLSETHIRLSDKKGASGIVRGLGRSYGDQAAINGGNTILNAQNNRIISFDESTNEIEVESGISLHELILAMEPKQRFPFVCPGTKYVTIGGAIANNIHGKGHHIDGAFIDHVSSFKLQLANGEVVNCSANENADLFRANAGGCGLLGKIITAKIKLRQIETPYFDSRAFKANNFDEMLELLDTEGITHHYSVGWIDALSSKNKGVLVCGDHSSKALHKIKAVSDDPIINVPPIIPNGILNKWSIKVLNRLIGFNQSLKNGLVHYDPFFFPLDGIGAWNNGYGQNGLLQFQFVIPIEKGHENLKQVLRWIRADGSLPFLNVIKRFGSDSNGFLSFPMEGYTLALDFAVSRKSILLCKHLCGEIAKMGGRVYLAKDAVMSADDMKNMYPEFQNWLKIKRSVDPKGVFASSMSKRIGLG